MGRTLSSKRVFVWLFGVLLAGGNLGCQPGYNLNLSLAPDYARKLGDEKVFVHVVPVPPGARDRLANQSLDSYWQYGGSAMQKPVREAGTIVYELDAGQPAVVLSREDPRWKRWRQQKVDELLILSSRPAPPREMSGESDPRRRFIPAATGRWEEPEVYVEVSDTGLQVLTPQKPRRR
jgi:hypothetical protein